MPLNGRKKLILSSMNKRGDTLVDIAMFFILVDSLLLKMFIMYFTDEKGGNKNYLTEV